MWLYFGRKKNHVMFLSIIALRVDLAQTWYDILGVCVFQYNLAKLLFDENATLCLGSSRFFLKKSKAKRMMIISTTNVVLLSLNLRKTLKWANLSSFCPPLWSLGYNEFTMIIYSFFLALFYINLCFTFTKPQTDHECSFLVFFNFSFQCVKGSYTLYRLFGW